MFKLCIVCTLNIFKFSITGQVIYYGLAGGRGGGAAGGMNSGFELGRKEIVLVIYWGEGPGENNKNL